MAEDTPPQSMARYNFTKTFDVLVGVAPHQERFIVHHDVLTKRSDFFRAARSERWTAGDTQKPADLEDEEPDVFRNYLHYVYFGRVVLQDAGTTDGDSKDNVASQTLSTNNEHKAAERFEALMKLFVLADKLGDHKTGNLAIDETVRTRNELKTLPQAKAVSIAYDSTVNGSPVRLLLRDYYVHESGRLPRDSFPYEFLQDVVEEYLLLKDDPYSFEELRTFSPTMHTADCKIYSTKYLYHSETPDRVTPNTGGT